jgi:type II secretory pathway pseudopilin PulG
MMRPSRHHAGFSYLGLLFLVATMGVVLAATGMIWSTAQQRNKERQLLFIGNQFRMAIATYYEKTPGTVKRYPNNLNDLLKDNRQLATARYLRRIYIDPMTNKPDWGLVQAPDGGIMGVYSLSNEAPLKRSNFRQRDLDFENANSYMKWKFVYEPQSLVTSPRNK